MTTRTRAATGHGTSLPRVDVVVATRGSRAQLLQQTLDAIWQQTYAGEITCYVVFDQCDPAPDIERVGPARRIVALRNERRTGLAGSRNTGALTGTSELVAFCDDDDEWLPEKLERQVAALGTTSAITSVTGITVEYGDNSVRRIPTPAEMTLRHLVRHRVMAAHPSTVVVRREALTSRIGLVDENLPGSYGEDFDWIIRSAQSGEFAVVQKALVKVRWGGSMFSRDWGTIVEAIDYSLAKHTIFSEDRYALARLYGRRAFALAGLGRRGPALRQTWQTLRKNPREKRAYLAGAVALGLVSAERLMHLAHTRGRGI